MEQLRIVRFISTRDIGLTGLVRDYLFNRERIALTLWELRGKHLRIPASLVRFAVLPHHIPEHGLFPIGTLRQVEFLELSDVREDSVELARKLLELILAYLDARQGRQFLHFFRRRHSVTLPRHQKAYTGLPILIFLSVGFCFWTRHALSFLRNSASVRTRIPSCSAFASLEPDSLPATTKEVFAETELATLPPA